MAQKAMGNGDETLIYILFHFVKRNETDVHWH